MIQPLILPRTRCLNDPVFTVLDSCLKLLSTAWPGHRTQLQRRSCTMHYTHVPVLSATAAHSLSATAALRYPAHHHSLSPQCLCLFLLCILFQYSSSLSMIDHVPGFIHCFSHESNVKRTLFLCMISS